jgi:galactose-1-phosphate uridylyltransferase
MLCMLNNVLLHLLGQMLNDQKLNLMCNITYILQLVVLGIESFWLCVRDYYLFVFQLDVHLLSNMKHYWYMCKFYVIELRPMHGWCICIHINYFEQ